VGTIDSVDLTYLTIVIYLYISLSLNVSRRHPADSGAGHCLIPFRADPSFTHDIRRLDRRRRVRRGVDCVLARRTASVSGRSDIADIQTSDQELAAAEL
jgi:hypothetical protein